MKQDKDPAGRISEHLRNAFRKPSKGERLIFTDLNALFELTNIPSWIEKAGSKMEQSEKDMKSEDKAYVFITNMSFHLHLESERDAGVVMPFGLGYPDFARVGAKRLSEIYRSKKRHIDAHKIAESFLSYGKLTSNFDGGLRSEEQASNRGIKIGESFMNG